MKADSDSLLLATGLGGCQLSSAGEHWCVEQQQARMLGQRPCAVSLASLQLSLVKHALLFC